jgi:hypothetical protein
VRLAAVLCGGAAAAGAAVLLPAVTAGRDRPRALSSADVVAGIAVSSTGPGAFAGDRPLLATISPNGDGFRDAAVIRLALRRAATVRIAIAPTQRAPLPPVYTHTYRLGAGRHRLDWAPPPTTPARTYVVLLDVLAGGRTWRFGSRSLEQARDQARDAPVVRVQGIDAFFAHQSTAPAASATLVVATDADALTLTMHRLGPERITRDTRTELSGPAVGSPLEFDWRAFRSRPHRLRIWIGNWASGLYYAELESSDGRVGYAPLVVRPAALGQTSRVAVVLPTNTWQTYNFYDEDGDGYGDTWYAGWRDRGVELDRPYLNQGVPRHLRDGDLPFARWLYLNHKRVEFLSDDHLDTLTGEQLAAAYDLVVFEGHEEYVDTHVYDAVQRYRDLGGNLMFLSANNFYWHVKRAGETISRDVPWRSLGRSEGQLIGVQYEGNDEGQRQLPYTVDAAGFDAAQWLWTGTNLAPGLQFGHYGVEVDGTAPSSPPGTVVLARIPNIYGHGYDAMMSYYETPAGARVFAAGVLTFGGQSLQPTESVLLNNLWARLSDPGTPAEAAEP